LVNDARRDGFLHPDSFTDVLARNPHHPGTRLLTPFADTSAHPTNSPFEDDFLAFIHRYRLPTPQINVHVNGREVDAYFPEHNLIVELDGWDYHKDREAFESDRERDAENLRHGLKTLRITKQRMTQTPDHEAERLQEILEDG
jgi:very-short-patch-repair endonuclease